MPCRADEGASLACVESTENRFVAIDGALEPLLGPADNLPAVDWAGPRTWWAGPLDVEGLARSSVTLALRAAAALADERGLDVRLGTSAERVSGNFGSLEHLRVDGRAPVGFAPLSGWFETTDGWIRLHGNYPHHAAVLQRVLGVRDRHELERVLHHLHSHETERRIRDAGGIAGALRTTQEWRATPAASAVDAQPWIQFGRHGSPGPVTRSPDGIMGGVRVLDLTRVIAGPVGTRLLALLGADVLRLDPPGSPELLDQHVDTGAGKRSGLADLANPAVAGAIHELLDSADVLVTGYRRGALDRFGLDVESVRERHPHLVHVTLSAWGPSGPWSDERGFDSIVQSVTGIGHLYGSEGQDGSFRPGALPVQALDHATGYGVAAAVLALLAARPIRGAGSAELSLVRTAHALLDVGPAPAAIPHELDIETMTSESAHGILTHVTAPATVDAQPLPMPPPGAYGQAEPRWV